MSKNIVLSGAGGVGKHVLDALLESKLFNVTVLSRGPKPELEARGAPVRVVDYDSVPALRQALADAGADTVLDFMVSFDDQAGEARAHRNLLAAGVSLPDGSKIKRYVPAEYGNDLARFPTPPTLEAGKESFRAHLKKVARREGVEATHVCIGIFMDFFLPPGRKKHFPDLPTPIMRGGDGASWQAMICGVAAEDARKGLGDKISLTMADDLGRAMVHLLQVPVGGWREFTYLSGDRLTWEEAADVVERVTGAAVERAYVGLPELQRRLEEARREPDKDGGLTLLWAELNEMFGNGSETLPDTAECFAGLKCTSWEEMVEEYYG